MFAIAPCGLLLLDVCKRGRSGGVLTQLRKAASLRDVAPAFWVVVLVGLVAATYIGVRSGGLDVPLERIPWGVCVPALTVFCFVHSWIMLGPRRAVALIAICVLFAFASEYIGQTTGTIFGPYCYTGLLGWKLFGRIPLLIPFAWYMMFYPSYIVTNILAEASPISARKDFTWILWLSVLSALVMTAWDVTMDPVMSYHPGPPRPGWCTFEASGSSLEDQANIGAPAWVWLRGGAHFGVPFVNYRGWLLTAFVVFLVFRLLELKIPEDPVHGHCSRIVAYLPVGVYATMTLTDTWLGSREIADIHLISPFVMGITCMFATMRLLAERTDLPLVPARKPKA
jgi:uncharacterized membrane protein